MTIANCPSGSLNVGKTISVQINVTNAPVNTINGFEFYLYYDPAYINATGVTTTGTVFSSQTFGVESFLPLGTVHLAKACACFNSMDNGPLININFKILAVGVSPLTLAVGLVSTGFQQSFTMLTTPAALAPATADGYFKNEPMRLGPVASFTFSPSSPKQQQQVTFDAGGSYDPDNFGAPNKGIILYKWDFGGASSQSSTVSSPTFTFQLGAVFGSFSVRLTVVDGDNKVGPGNFTGMQTQLFTVSQNPFHDLVAQSITPTPSEAHPGDSVTVNVIVRNNGTFRENFNLTILYSAPTTVFGTQANQSIDIGASIPFTFKLDTSGLAADIYILTAKVTVLPSTDNTKAVENIPANNVASTTLTILGGSSSSPLLLIAGGTVAVVAVLGVAGLLLRRRRRATDSG